MKEALPGLKAKERSIDPDLLLAELSMMATGDPDPERAAVERELDALAKPGAAAAPAVPGGEGSNGTEDALAALKRKMGL